MMNNHWLEEKEASKQLGVSEKTLIHWREIGYLKPGTHWRSSPDQESIPWKPNVVYHLSWCKEVIDYWREKDAPIGDLAA